MDAPMTGKAAALGRLRLATLAYDAAIAIDDESHHCWDRLADQQDALWDAHLAGCTLIDMAAAMEEPISVTNLMISLLRQERT